MKFKYATDSKSYIALYKPIGKEFSTEDGALGFRADTLQELLELTESTRKNKKYQYVKSRGMFGFIDEVSYL